MFAVSWGQGLAILTTVGRNRITFFMRKKHLGDFLFFLAFLFCLCSLITVIVFLYDEEKRAEEHDCKIELIDRRIEANRREREQLEALLKNDVDSVFNSPWAIDQ